MSQNIISADTQAAQDYLKAHGSEYQMKPVTASLIPPAFVGKEHVTYVLDNEGNVVVEGKNTYSHEVVEVKFPTPIGELDGKKVYNAWLVKKDKFEKTYGGLPKGTLGGEKFQKPNPDFLVEIDDELMKIFGAEPGADSVDVGVFWADDGKMKAFKGGLYTGYHVIAKSMADIMYEKL